MTTNSTLILTGYYGVFEPHIGHVVRGESTSMNRECPMLAENPIVEDFRRLFNLSRVTGAWFDSDRYQGVWNMEDKILNIPLLDAVTMALKNTGKEVTESNWAQEVFIQAMVNHERIIVIDTIFPEWIVDKFSLVKENGTNICGGVPGVNLYRYKGFDALLVRTDFDKGITESHIKSIRNYILS